MKFSESWLREWVNPANTSDENDTGRKEIHAPVGRFGVRGRVGHASVWTANAQRLCGYGIRARGS